MSARNRWRIGLPLAMHLARQVLRRRSGESAERYLARLGRQARQLQAATVRSTLAGCAAARFEAESP
jgi:hypothetical protein